MHKASTKNAKKKRAPCLPFLSAAWPSVPLEFQPAQAAEQDLETLWWLGVPLFRKPHNIYIYTYNYNYNFDYYYIYNGWWESKKYLDTVVHNTVGTKGCTLNSLAVHSSWSLPRYLVQQEVPGPENRKDNHWIMFSIPLNIYGNMLVNSISSHLEK